MYAVFYSILVLTATLSAANLACKYTDFIAIEDEKMAPDFAVFSLQKRNRSVIVRLIAE